VPAGHGGQAWTSGSRVEKGNAVLCSNAALP